MGNTRGVYGRTGSNTKKACRNIKRIQTSRLTEHEQKAKKTRIKHAGIKPACYKAYQLAKYASVRVVALSLDKDVSYIPYTANSVVASPK